MKALLLVSALILSSTLAHAAEPLDVQLNAPAYAGVVKGFLDSKRAEYRFVKEAGEHSYLKIEVLDQSSGFSAACKVTIDSKIGGTESSGTVSKSFGFASREKKANICRDVLSDALTQMLGWSL